MGSEQPYPVYQPVARQPSTSIHVDIVKSEEDTDGQLSPGSSLMSPVTPSDLSSAARRFSSDSPELSYPHELTTGPKRSKSSPSMKGQVEREKRKRSRVTQEQLVHLEQFFAEDRIPTAARRKEISQFLGMQERQTQIWFQNRRAKAKLLDNRKTQRISDEPTEKPPQTPPDLLSAQEPQLEGLIHEDDAITIIPCMELNIGWWRRLANGGKPDLVAYICERRGCLTWFVHSSDRGFKIEIPFHIIVDSQFTTAAPGTAIASFFLSEPPLFYTENVCTPIGATTPVRTWQASADWTEGMQASATLRHDLCGSVAALAHLVRKFHMSSPGSGVQLVSPYGTPDESARTPAPQPPVTPAAPDPSTTGGDLSHSKTPRPEYFGHGRRRSSSGPPILTHPPFHRDPGLPRVLAVPEHLDPRVGGLLGPSSASSSMSSPCSPYSRGSPYSSTHPTPVTPDYPLPTDGRYQCSNQILYNRWSSGGVSPASATDDPANSFFVDKASPYDPNTGLTALSMLSMDPNSSAMAHPQASPILTTPLHWQPRVLTPDGNPASLYDEPAFLEPLTGPPSNMAASPYWTSHYVQYQSGQ